jgi:hypothetical protein
LTTDQVAAEYEEKIDTDPAEPMQAVRKREPENAGVVNDNQDDREGAEKIETRLTLAIGKARVDRSFAHGISDART